jgi:hypothetical protein
MYVGIRKPFIHYPSWSWNEVHRLLDHAKVLDVNQVVMSLDLSLKYDCYGFCFFGMHSVVEIKIFFNMMCAVHYYSLIFQAFSHSIIMWTSTFDLLCDLT